VKDLFSEYTIEPFVDNKGTWLVRYFGKICMHNIIVDIVADEKMNLETNPQRYTKATWNGRDVFVEPLEERLRVERLRQRVDRIYAIEDFMKNNKV
jgi:hypothetical protein